MTADDFLIRVRRPCGTETVLRIRSQHLQRAMDMANREFGNIYSKLGGPELPKQKGTPSR